VLCVTVGAAGQQVVEGVGDWGGVGATVGCGATALGRLRAAAFWPDADADRDGDRLAREGDGDDDGETDAAAVADALVEAAGLEAAELGAADDEDGAGAPEPPPAPYM
jgi:hypothetical protein